jgi:hypothetical protein
VSTIGEISFAVNLFWLSNLHLEILLSLMEELEDIFEENSQYLLYLCFLNEVSLYLFLIMALFPLEKWLECRLLVNQFVKLIFPVLFVLVVGESFYDIYDIFMLFKNDLKSLCFNPYIN